MHKLLNVLKTYIDGMATVVRKLVVFFKENKYHFVGWAIFITYETFVVGVGMGKFYGFLNYLISYTANISLFYLHSLVVLPAGLKKNKLNILGVGFMIVLEWCMYFIIITMIMPAFNSFPDFAIKPLSQLTYQNYIETTWRFLYFIGYSWAYFFIRRFRFKNKKNIELEQKSFLETIKKKDLEKELIKSNYAFLRTRVNPHFLFNLLNFLYDETKKSSAEAADVILALSETMQYSLGDFEKNEFVLVSDEIEQAENFIYLNQLQYENKLSVDLNYSNEVVHLEIIPLVLLTVVENMFQHGDLVTSEKKASVDLYIRDGVFYITTINPVGVKGIMEKQWVGLDNVKKRLEFTYREGKLLTYLVSKNQFVVRIKIPLSSLANPVRLGNKTDGN